jgi:hypothetical protein
MYGEPYGMELAELKLGFPFESKTTKSTAVVLASAVTLFTVCVPEVLAANNPSDVGFACPPPYLAATV